MIRKPASTRARPSISCLVAGRLLRLPVLRAGAGELGADRREEDAVDLLVELLDQPHIAAVLQVVLIDL
jgi:hypothetical protein